MLAPEMNDPANPRVVQEFCLQQQETARGIWLNQSTDMQGWIGAAGDA